MTVAVCPKPTKNQVQVGSSTDGTAFDRLLTAFRVQSLQFDTAIANISQGLCFFDPNGRLVLSNRRYAEIYGLSPDQIRPGMVLSEIIALRAATGAVPNMTPDQYVAWTQAETNALAPNGAVVHLKTGRVVSVRHHPIEGGGYVSTHEDITERWIAEAAMRHGEKLRAVGQLTGGIAHDLANLVTMIGGAVEEVLAQTGNCCGVQRELEDALRSIDSASALLRRMMGFSRSLPPTLEPTDLNTWFIPLRDMTARMLGPRFRLEFRPDPTLQALPLDRSQLESAILNLILNARDAMRAGGAITVETEALTIADDTKPDPTGLPAGLYVAITVRDGGPGMPPDVAARVFEPFFSTKPVGSGTGLGLTMVQQFVRQAGGAVSLRSTLGEGTSVRIVLPRDSGGPQQSAN